MSALPREVLFEVMRNSFHITYKELCEAILSDEPVGGLSPKARGRDAARRNREFVHVGPGADDTCWALAPYREYVKTLYTHIIGTMGVQNGTTAIISVLSDSGAEELREALDACGLDGSIYSNLVNYIIDGTQSDTITAHLLLHLFVVTATTGSPSESAREVINMVYQIKDERMGTSTPVVKEYPELRLVPQNYALMRCSGYTLYPARTYPLSTDRDGTEVGSILLSSNCITDVERGVSRAHLLIWQESDYTWWCKGLLSLNGTILVDGATHEQTVVEPPKSERTGEYEAKAFQIKLGDFLILAGTTEFMVVSIGS